MPVAGVAAHVTRAVFKGLLLEEVAAHAAFLPLRFAKDGGVLAVCGEWAVPCQASPQPPQRRLFARGDTSRDADLRPVQKLQR